MNLRPVRGGAMNSFGGQARWIRGEANWWVMQEPKETPKGVDDEAIKLESTGGRDYEKQR